MLLSKFQEFEIKKIEKIYNNLNLKLESMQKKCLEYNNRPWIGYDVIMGEMCEQVKQIILCAHHEFKEI